MNHCPYCGKALEEPCRFCPYCGRELPQSSKLHKAPTPRKLNFKFFLAIPVIAVLTLLLIFTKSGNAFSEDTRAIANASASVVTIYTYDVNNVNLGSGSGFAAIDEGIIITNYHVIEGETYRIEAVTEDKIVMEADSVIAYDAEKDIAILRFTDCTLPTLPTVEGLALERGEPLTAIGSPKGLNNMVSTGVFSQYLDDIDTGIIYQLFTTSISHGSSGGALFDDDGSVVGITSAIYKDANDIYMAVPFIYVTELYDNRSPTDEISPAKLWEQSDHVYTVDYVLNFPRQLNGKTIELQGYVSAVYHDLYIQASPELPIIRQSVNELSQEERDYLRSIIREELNAGNVLMCQWENRGGFSDDLICKQVTLRGKVTVFTENIAGDDVRFIVSEVISSE